MADKIPFDEDTMTLIMGLGGPEKPGQHGRTMIPAPENSEEKEKPDTSDKEDSEYADLEPSKEE